MLSSATNAALGPYCAMDHGCTFPIPCSEDHIWSNAKGVTALPVGANCVIPFVRKMYPAIPSVAIPVIRSGTSRKGLNPSLVFTVGSHCKGRPFALHQRRFGKLKIVPVP